MSLLKLDGLTASYGTSQALFGVDLEIAEGEVVALMGRNGMGKTTTVKAICRMIQSGGHLSLAGQDLHPLPSHRVARLGVNPRLLILDEATEGLAPIVRQEIWSAIRALKRDTQLSILLIDKSLRELAGVSDRAVILERGRTVWAGAMADLTPDLNERYVGV
jgi:branched-chain amino acid transport system ATP-binding protein